MKLKIKTLLIIGIVSAVSGSCKKYLDVKQDSAYSVVSTVDDVQHLLNSGTRLNQDPDIYLGESSADNFYIPQPIYDSYSQYFQSLGEVYTWGKYPFIGQGPVVSQWSMVYATIMITNTALDGLSRITVNESNRTAINYARGYALAFRGYHFWKIATAFSKSYNTITAATDLGIPLKMTTNINEKTVRASVQQSYDQIIKDMKEALPLLPSSSATINLPSKASVYAMLSEVYLSMREYDQAKRFADSSLMIKRDLIDYNLLDKSSTAPIPVALDNKEILIHFSTYQNSYLMTAGWHAVDSALYKSYKSNDLRKRFFYTDNGDGTHYFSGTYFISPYLFTGPTTAEMYLTRAECSARAGDTDGAMADLNTLMKNRVEHSPAMPYVDYVAGSPTEALQIILAERRKELAFRDLRWMDIKRLNLEGANIVLTRKISGKTYTLLPNANRYAIPIPPEVVQLSGVPQNPE